MNPAGTLSRTGQAELCTYTACKPCCKAPHLSASDQHIFAAFVGGAISPSGRAPLGGRHVPLLQLLSGCFQSHSLQCTHPSRIKLQATDPLAANNSVASNRKQAAHRMQAAACSADAALQAFMSPVLLAFAEGSAGLLSSRPPGSPADSAHQSVLTKLYSGTILR